MRNIYLLLLSLLFTATAVFGQGQLQDVKICLDPGHGGHNPANDRKVTLPHGLVFWESEGNLMTALHERDLLQSLGANVKMTRTANDDSDDISLSSRVAIANAFGADYFQSNHTNAGSGSVNYSLVLFKGTDNNPVWPDAKAMGAIMGPNLQDLLETTRNYNRGDKSFLGFNLGVLRNTNMPATLSEGSFHDIPAEALRLKNSEYSKNYAWALAKSFCKYFDVDGFSTGRVGGIVTDRNTGEVINNVQVTCQPGDKTYIGDDYYNGFYAIGELAPGTYTLTFSRSGYFDISKTVTIKANKYVDMDLSLPIDNNGAPYADFDIIGLPAEALDTLIFDAGKSADNGQIVKYEWFLSDSIALDTGKIIKYAFAHDGQYLITLKLTDDENNTSSLSKTVQIKTEPPKTPVLLSVLPVNNNKGVKIKWKRNTQSDFVGYRIYYNINPFIENIRILADTNILKPDVTELEIDSLGSDNLYVFSIVAVNRAGYESERSDEYGIMHYPFDTNKKLLIVDGFHRRSSYSGISHNFATACYLWGLWDASGHVDVATTLNERVIKGDILLDDYDMVVWFLGDESTVDETFNAVEQNKVKDYLNQGGKLFVTGSEIGWDLDHKGSSTDKSFYHDYLKASFVDDGTTGRAPASGINGLAFDGVILHYGEVYIEDYPDVIAPTEGAQSVLKYNEGSIAGIAYKGTFGDGNAQGAIVNIGFPLETVNDKFEVKFFMEKLLRYFDVASSTIDNPRFVQDNSFEVFPTVFSDKINMISHLGKNDISQISIYNLKGQKVYFDKLNFSKNHTMTIQLPELISGNYILRIENNHRFWNYKIVKQ